MPGPSLNRVVQFLRRATDPAGGDEDGELLRRFVAAREEAAFAGLVRRHGAMVLGVCRRVLDDAHEAEDAFQATFLVLARRAAAVRKQDSVASWLYGVAYRVALKARTASARRNPGSGAATEPASADDPAAEAAWRELRPVIDEELSHLPEKYRAPLILCYLEGKTNEEAARLLGWTKGTVSGRLARARDLLRPRLARRGLGLAGGGVAVLLAQHGAPTASAALLETTISAVLAGRLSAPAAAIAGGVMRAMFLKKLTTLAALVVGLGIVAGGVGLLRQSAPGGEEQRRPSAPRGEEQPEKAKPGVVFTLPEESKKEADDLPKLQGVWQAVTLEHNGEKLSAEAAQKFRVVIRDNTITFDPEGNKREASFALATGSKPKAILLKTDPKAPMVCGIYEVTDRELKICLDNDTGKTTPTEFATKRNSGLTLIELRRVPEAKAGDEKRYSFSMKDKPWKEVIDWFADQSGLAFSGVYKPTGNFTFVSPPGKQYTLPEIIDILNESLMPQKYILITRTQTFTLWPADERLSDGPKGSVSIEDLPKYGKSEIVRVNVRVKSGKAADLAPDLRKQMSAWGDVIVIEPTNQLILIDTVASLREIVKTLQASGALEAKTPAEKRYTFSMKDKPWKDIGEWFADVSGLRYTGKETPPGTFTFNGPKDKQYTIPEIVDIINDALLADKKAPYLLIRRPRQPPAGTFAFVPADEKVPPASRIELDELDKYGRTEIVFVMLKLKGGHSADVTAALRKLQSPWGSATSSAGGLRLTLIDTAGSVREIVKALKEGDLLDEPETHPLRTFKDSDSPIRAVAFSPDGKTLWTCPEDGRVSAWDVATGKKRASLNGDGNKWVAMAVSPDGKYVLTGGIIQATEGKGDDARKVDAGVMAGYSAGLKGIWYEVSPSTVRAVAYSPDGKRAAGACDDGGVLIRDAETGKAIMAPGHGRQYGPLAAVAFSPDGKLVAAAGDEGKIRFWDVATGKEVRLIDAGRGKITSLAFSPDGRSLLTTSGGQLVRVWDVATGKDMRIQEAVRANVNTAIFSPDGKRFAWGVDNGAVRLHDVGGSKVIASYENQKKAVTGLAFSPDGKTLAAATAGGTAYLWDVAK
jgi:RNA polymerase sigma-70 factor (ECF subfamily)